MGSRSRRSPTVGVAIALCVLAPACLASASASGADAQNRGYLESTVRYLQEAQNPDGGFGATPGGPSDPDISAWAAIGLAAAGINPQEQAKAGGHSVYAYLTEHAGELSLTTDFERALLVADAAGTSPRDFGGVDLVQRILERKLPENGAFVHEAGQAAVQDVSDTVFAILALSPVLEPEVQGAVQKATEWLIEQQSKRGQSEGSWNATCLESLPSCDGPEGEGPHGEVDMTAAAVEALNAAGDRGGEAQAKALAFLHRAQSEDGGFPEFFPREPGEAQANAASTSWTVQALCSAGENAESWGALGTGANPLQFLASLQHANGSISYLPGESEGAVWWSAYTGSAFAGRCLPVPASADPLRPPAPAAEPPQAGTSTTVQPAPAAANTKAPSRHGAGVLAGGGGRGARLFSRPAPAGQGSGTGPRDPEPPAVAGGPTSSEAKPGAPSSGRSADASRPASPPQPSTAGVRRSEPQVAGLLLDEPLASRAAPGLRSAAAGGSWATTAILVGLALLVIAGARLERRRHVIADRV